MYPPFNVQFPSKVRSPNTLVDPNISRSVLMEIDSSPFSVSIDSNFMPLSVLTTKEFLALFDICRA